MTFRWRLAICGARTISGTLDSRSAGKAFSKRWESVAGRVLACRVPQTAFVAGFIALQHVPRLGSAPAPRPTTLIGRHAQLFDQQDADN